MKSARPDSPLPIILDARTDRFAAGMAGFESITHPNATARHEIRHRAYSIWECAGRPADREVAHWLEAEAEVMGSSGR